jgi:hypothetical protein
VIAAERSSSTVDSSRVMTLASPQSSRTVSPYSPIMMFFRFDIAVDHLAVVSVGDGVADVNEVANNFSRSARERHSASAAESVRPRTSFIV